MNKEVVQWLTHITEQYAECSCGEKCNIELTISKRCLKFFVFCPKCHKTYAYRELIELSMEAMIDVTDIIINKVKREFKKG